MDQHEKAQAFRRMHVEPPILVLPNAWDVASAKALAAIGGCRALATSSAAVARSLGFEDGERAPGAVMVEAAGRIAQAVDVPVTGDLERGYNDPVGTARAAW
jgi:2-methylisocitrate lyase-like PEP mutase family enzyme